MGTPMELTPDQRSAAPVGRSAAAKALEFAEYMAKRAEHVLEAIDADFLAKEQVEYADDDDALSDEENSARFSALESEAECARQVLSDSLIGLRSAVYEFRKRAASLAAGAAEPAWTFETAFAAGLEAGKSMRGERDHQWVDPSAASMERPAASGSEQGPLGRCCYGWMRVELHCASCAAWKEST